MSEISNEKIQWLHDAATEFARTGMKMTMNPDEVLQLTTPLLALRERAEPDYIRYDCGCCGWETIEDWRDNDACPKCNHKPMSKTELYAAPPAPVDVPNELVSELLDIAKRAAEEADECANAEFSDNSMKHAREIAEWERRATMLQSVSAPYKLPDGWIACSEQLPEREYVLAADFSGAYYPPSLPNTQVGFYADWFEDGKPSWDDGDGNDLHLKQVTHWMPLPEAPGKGE
ncbi:DUF551 domain-containing protein [Cronobacter sakazakii]|uniref:DUF551 domain-containing protein n=1 Tax=Cronobacter sakazakii TaxID=28141 RepID=UPI001EFD5786|nr:DUF551 domain-containing protein [Cronobacter sakazakii]